MIECRTTGMLFTNSYIISNENKECVIVDPGMGYKKAYDEIKGKYDVKAILLTHCHIDHIDGLQYYLDTPIYIGENDLDNLYSEDVTLYEMFGRANPYNPSMLNIKALRHGDIIKLIGHEFKVLYTPGHTEGCVCYLMDNNTLFSGDTLFNASIGRTDYPSGSYAKIMESLNYLMTTLDDDVIVYPGHGDITTIGEEKINNPFLR